MLATPRPSPVPPARALRGARAGSLEAVAGPSPSADRGTTELRSSAGAAGGPAVARLARAPAGRRVAGRRSRIDRHVTVNSELARTRGIRLSN